MTAVERVRATYEAIDAAERPEIWISLRPMVDALADADVVDSAVQAGADLPLAGLTAAVKNNVDVAGIATTAACPAYATTPASEDATAVSRLRAAGAVVIGATNLDQFATGLVGTRSPYGAVPNATKPSAPPSTRTGPRSIRPSGRSSRRPATSKRRACSETAVGSSSSPPMR